MFSKIRARASYANVGVTLALVFAMTGGAFAASKYVITSIKQIKPSVVKQLQGKAGPAGPEGKAGASGPVGKDGVQGPKGDLGEKGVAGTPGAPGKEGSPWTVGGVLPSGKTESGAWALSVPPEDSTLETIISTTAISFVIPLATEPAAHYLKEGEGGTAECPGNAVEPKAEPGQLCIYTEIELDVPPVLSPTPHTFGATLNSFGGGQSGGVAIGSWAVTAE
jgi:hypothetical protein